MKEINNIQLEERNHYSATKWGIIAIIYALIVSSIFKIGMAEMFNPKGFLNLTTFSTLGLVFLSTWVVRIVIVVWIVKIAKTLNRSMFGWGVFAFVFPPISLIIIGWLDYKISDTRIKVIVDNTRLDFKAELLHIKNTKDICYDEIKEIETELRIKFNKILKNRIVDLIAKEKTEYLGQLKTEDILDSNLNLEDQEELIRQSLLKKDNQEETEKWMNNSDNCPACGAKVNHKIAICIDCGLTLI